MHFDFLTLACLVDEINELAPARIQQVTMVTDRAIALELYAGRRVTLWLDTDPRHARALLSEAKARRGPERDTPLLLLLRKYARGARLHQVRQLPWERVMLLDIESSAGNSVLVAEIMGRYSNLILLDGDGTVRAALRTAGRSNETRAVLPGRPYELPPSQLQPVPTRLSVDEWRTLLATCPPDEPLARSLPRKLAATSPTLARELVARATGDAGIPPADAAPEALAEAAAQLFAPLESGVWQPHVERDEDGAVIAFAPYELHQAEASEPVATISQAVAAYFASRLADDGYATARAAVAHMIEEARDRTRGTLYQLRQQVVEPEEIEGLRLDGELLLAYQWQIPADAAIVELPDYEGTPRRISLDPALSAVENAQRLFERYDKKKRAAEAVPPRIETAELSLAFLDSLATDLTLAEERPEIEAVREALAEAGLVAARRRARGGGVVRGPRRVVLGDWVALVGRNARQNDEVTFRLGTGEDLWLHARGVPGSHVILKRAGAEPPSAIIERAAQLAAYYSQARDSGEVAVDVTERRHVRRLPGAHPGLVSYRNEQTLYVRPASADQIEEEPDDWED